MVRARARRGLTNFRSMPVDIDYTATRVCDRNLRPTTINIPFPVAETWHSWQCPINSAARPRPGCSPAYRSDAEILSINEQCDSARCRE